MKMGNNVDFLNFGLYSWENDHETWPTVWKRETVSVIPKNLSPAGLSEMRNISCTPVLSKVMEFFLLERLRSEVTVKPNQFGGIPGCGIDHYLVEVWDSILQSLDQPSSVSTLISVDFAKAFNTMSYQACLTAFHKKGCSPHLTRMIASFLSGREMLFRVGDSLSSPRPLNGGSPQGTLLGNFMFIITTDNLEDDHNAIGYERTAIAEAEDEQESPDCPSDASSSSDSDQDPAVSTPRVTENEPVFEPGITPFRKGSSNFVFLDKARNVRRAIGLDVTQLRDRTLPPEPNHWTDAIWKARRTGVHKFVDDNILDTKINMDTAEDEVAVDGTRTKTKHAVDTQNVFKRTIRNAELIGMRVNTAKTNLLCVSDSLTFKAQARITAGDGSVLTSEGSKELKLLGFRFGNRPNCTNHIEAVKKSFRGRYWMLIHMKQNHFTEKELLKAYTVIVRPVAEYCSVVYHPMITDQQDEQIERLQATALRYIYGYGPSYAKMREMSGLDTLRARRIDACDKFAMKCAESDRFSHWFPLNNTTRRSRHTLPYKEEYARCDRLKNSPLFYMRRRLNGKEGKAYGQRNKKYRDN